MSKPPIYPKGYNPDHPFDVSMRDGSMSWSRPSTTGWPTMLGLLTIIGDAVRGVPWGKPVASPVLPEVGSVWIDHDGDPVLYEGAMLAGGVAVGLIFSNVFRSRIVVELSEIGSWTPATVIPTPTADAWRRLADERPAEGEMCWWVIDGGADHEIWLGTVGASAKAAHWLWQPVPPGVIPPPPADRDGGQ